MGLIRAVTRSVCLMVVVAMLGLSLQAPAYAGMVSTAAVMEGHQITADQQRVLDLLAREDVQQQLVTLGVDPQAARDRVAALSEDEARLLAGRMQSMPAGGSDILGVAVFIFLVLLVTDILGFTHVFPFVKKTIR